MKFDKAATVQDVITLLAKYKGILREELERSIKEDMKSIRSIEVLERKIRRAEAELKSDEEWLDWESEARLNKLKVMA